MKKGLIITAVSLAVAVCLIMSLFAGVYGSFISDNALVFETDEALFSAAKSLKGTVYYAKDEYGNFTEVYKRGEAARREWCRLGDVSKYVIDGFISAEDRKFYNHNGINLKRTAFAMANYLLKLRDEFGASTITQQVVKNISGDNERTVKRKLAEVFRAVKIENNHSKDEILELYLNIIPMSGNLYGIAAASEKYFGKQPKDLTLAESATLVGMTNSPTRYDPIRHPAECLKKRNNVLYAMFDNGAITEWQYNSAKNEELIVKESDAEGDFYSSWFIETVENDVISDLMKTFSINKNAAKLLLGSGMKIYTTLDITVQKALEALFTDRTELFADLDNGLEGAITVFDSKSGDLVGIVGSAKKKKGERLLNLAESKRPPGSTLKPLALYAPLLDEKKINWATVFDDVPQNLEVNGEEYMAYPRNSPDKYQGLINVADAIRLSKNTVASQAYEMLGSNRIYNVLKDKYGINSIVKGETRNGSYVSDMGLAPLALGQLTDGISLRKLTHCYTAFCSGGVLRGGRSYTRVETVDGGLVLDNKVEIKPVMNETTARIMCQLLSLVVENGTAKSVTLNNYVDTAGKTGTSGGSFDKTFVGFTPYFTAGIWFGFPEGGRAVSIGQNHLILWDEIMQAIHKSVFSDIYNEPESFSTEGLKLCEYCLDSGEIPCEACEYDERGERCALGYFTTDNMPQDLCSAHVLCYEDEYGNLSLNENEEFIYKTSRLKINRRTFPDCFTIEDEDYRFTEIDTEFMFNENPFIRKTKKYDKSH